MAGNYDDPGAAVSQDFQTVHHIMKNNGGAFIAVWGACGITKVDQIMA